MTTPTRRSVPICSENRTIPKLVVRVRFPSPALCHKGPGQGHDSGTGQSRAALAGFPCG
jgi:hypothetical protein